MNAHRVAEQLLVDEGLRLKPYRCTAGKLTIGVGRNLEDKGISAAEALGLLDNDIDEFWKQLTSSLPWVLTAPEVVQEVLLNMAFNLGVPGLLKFKETLRLLQAGEYSLAAGAMLDSKWAKQVGPRAERLSHRIKTLA